MVSMRSISVSNVIRFMQQKTVCKCMFKVNMEEDFFVCDVKPILTVQYSSKDRKDRISAISQLSLLRLTCFSCYNKAHLYNF